MDKKTAARLCTQLKKFTIGKNVYKKKKKLFGHVVHGSGNRQDL